jgi:hypothetical protein
MKVFSTLKWQSIFPNWNGEALRLKEQDLQGRFGRYQLKIGVVNRGRMPTALKQAHLVKIVREDRIELEFDTAGWQRQTFIQDHRG